VQKIVMEIENVRDLVTRMADKSMKAASNAESIGTMALQGSGAIEEQKSQMESNRRVIDDMRNAIEELQQKSEQIGNIMQVITDIASQTNLLSLNASIEAARTGEQGRGFNVVAQEVRKLAEESARSAYEIGQLVANIQTSITQVVNETRAANRAVLEQEKAMDESLQVIDKVSNNFKSISHDMSNVSSRCQGIVGAVDEVTTAIQGISAVTQENSAGSEEMSSTAEEQSAYMQSLNGLVDEFDTLLKNLKSTIGKFRTVD
ncbi:MAG: methyl-accepting chemotaxis protein, partial [Chitinophagales bacterium]